jgi:hypothetical protein
MAPAESSVNFGGGGTGGSTPGLRVSARRASFSLPGVEGGVLVACAA